MPDIRLENIKPAAAKRIKPFFDEILGTSMDKIHSLHVTGTALSDDFDDRDSTVNSVIVLKEMDLKFLELLAPLGKKYRKTRVAAPLIMTPHYIRNSLDVFPVEFLNFKLFHATVFGEDIFRDIIVDRMHLRHQCERELKVKLIGLRQGYLSSLGDRKILTEGFVNSMSQYIPLFRSIIVLFDKEPPVRHGEVIKALAEAVPVNTGVFAEVLKEKHEKVKLSIEKLNTIFEDYYSATELLGKVIDDIQE